MVFAIVLILLLGVSMGISYRSVKNDMKKQQHIADVQKKLERGRVLYYPSSS